MKLKALTPTGGLASTILPLLSASKIRNAIPARKSQYHNIWPERNPAMEIVNISL